MITAFKQYLSTLRLSPVSRKLYLSDIRRFLHWLESPVIPSVVEGPVLDQLIHPESYSSYLDSLRAQAMAPSMLKRTIASLRQFGAFISLTYSLPNPVSTSLQPKTSNLTPNFDYIKHFTKYLETEQLSPLTIKSYKSDITRYLDWASTYLAGTELSKVLIDKNIEKYLNYLTDSESTLSSTIERKGKSIARFATWYEQVYAKVAISDNNAHESCRGESMYSPANTHISCGEDISPTTQAFISPDHIRKSVKTFNYRTALSFAILMIFASTLAIFGYRQFSRDASLTAAYPGTPVTPNRQLSFQGRLENAAGTPIVGPTNMVFKLWNAVSAGTELYSTGTCSITSDSDGVFSTQIGGTCGAGITSSVFTENSNVWLEVTVGAEVLAPRQPIASVAYALNSETLQGLPIGTTTSTIPYINSSNTVSLTDANPKLTSTSGTFQISGPSLSFITAAGSNGNITFAPDGTGQVNVNGNTTSTNFFNVSNAQLTTGSLITGTASNNNVGFKLLDLLSGSSPTSKFSVSDAGNTTIAGSLTLSPLDCTSYANGGTLTTDGSGVVSCANDDGGGSSSNWKRVTGNLSPLIADDTISATTSAAIALTLTQTGAFNALLVEDQASDSTPFVIDQSGNVGIGTSSPATKLDVVSTAALSAQIGGATNSYLRVVDDAGNDVFLQSSAYPYGGRAGTLSNQDFTLVTNSNNVMTLKNTGNVGIGTTAPADKFQISAGSSYTTIGNVAATYGGIYFGNAALSPSTYNIASDAMNSTLLNTGAAGSIGFRINNVDKMVVNSIGNVGIGTSTPYAKLDITKDTTTPTNEADYGIRIADPTDDTGLLIGVSATDNTAIIQSIDPATSWTTRNLSLMPNGGNVGIGTLAPIAKLQVEGAGYFSGDIANGGISAIASTYNNTNVTPNPSFEVATTSNFDNWIDLSSGGTAIRSTSSNHDGTYGIAMAATSSNMASINSTSIPVSPSTAYTLSTWAKVDTACGDGFYLRANWYDYLGNFISVSDPYSNSSVPTTSWALYSGNITSPANAYTAKISLFNYLPNNTCTLSVDQVSFRQNIDGDLLVNGGLDLAASSYINWGATIGTSGYGFRDNAGNIEFKNSAGTWAGVSAGSGSAAFTDITSGTNTTAAMLVGTGASLDFTGTGTINASSLLGGTWAAPGTIGSTTPNSAVFTNLTSNGNTILGNAITDTITFGGRVALDSDLIPIGTTGTNDLGSALLPWDNLYANSITLPSFTPGSVIFTGTSGVLSQDNSNFFFDDTNNRLGIGTISPLATLDVRATLGTAPAASISGNTSQATLVVDQSGIGDLFTASKSGDTKFVITNAGNVGIGVSAPTNKLEIGGSTSTISNAAGDITIDSASNNISFGGDSLINILNTYVSGELGIGVADAVSKLHVHGATAGKALAIFNELGDQDIFTASSSGTTRFRLTNDGNLSLDGDYLNFGLTDGTSGYGVRDNAGIMEFKSLSGAWTAMGAGGASWWDQTLGTLQPYNTTVDLLLGGTSTESAKIALININSGTPTASISAGIAGATYIKANGTIATTAKQTLALGDATTTGNILLQGGNVGIGVASPTEKLEVNGYIVAQRFVDSSSATSYLDPANSATSLSILGDVVNTDGTSAFKISSTTNQNIIIDAGSGTVMIGAAGAGKLDAGTVDPPYTINGEKFATYMAGMTGVKEETTGVIHASEYVSNIGYRATLDLATSSEGSDLWLFGKASNLKNNLDKLVVLLAGSSNTKTWYEIDAQTGKLHLYSLAPTTISYRLTAPRYDANTWANTRDESSTSIGHVIEDNTGWSVPPAIAALFNNTPVELVSPLASSSAITISSPIIIAPSEPSQEPALVVDGELDAATISARTAILQSIEAETITAKNIIADTIEANHIIGLDAKIASLSGLTDGEFETITDRIKARLAELTGNIPSADDIPAPQEAIASQTPSGAEGEVGLTASSSATLSSADIDFVTINSYLAVIGTATITTLDVTNGLYTDSIDSKTGRLALADDTLIVDEIGQVSINGDLTVSGKIIATELDLKQLNVYNEDGVAVATIDASGSANLTSLTTNMITIASAPTATGSALAELLGTAHSNSTAGESVLISPNTELTIESPYVTSDSLVYLTPTGNTQNKVLFVKSKNTCAPNLSPITSDLQPSCTPSFTIGIDLPASSDISFNWWIIELAPPKIEDNL